MRRCLHAFLVGLLVLSMSADAARGCWCLRRYRPRACRAAVACPPSWASGPVATVAAWTACDRPVECGCGVTLAEPVDMVVAGPCDAGIPDEVIVESAMIESGVIETEIVDSGIVGSEIVADEAVERVTPPAAPNPAPAAASVVKLPDAAVPELEPVADDVRRASADGPAALPAPSPEPAPPTAPVEPAVVEEVNLFELADAAEAGQEGSPAEQAPAEIPDRPAADEPPADADGESPEPDGAEPRESANPLDAAERRSGEPARLWIDATGRHAVVGVLVDVRGDGTCVLDTGAEMLEVPAAALRRRDRDYAEQAAARLAEVRRPAVSETVAR